MEWPCGRRSTPYGFASDSARLFGGGRRVERRQARKRRQTADCTRNGVSVEAEPWRTTAFTRLAVRIGLDGSGRGGVFFASNLTLETLRGSWRRSKRAQGQTAEIG